MPRSVVHRLRCHWSLAALFLLMYLAGAGCASHIHNPADQALADQAQKQLQAVIKAEQERLTATMANLERIHTQESQAHREFGEKAAQAISQLVLGMTWDNLRTAFADPTVPGSLLKGFAYAHKQLLADINGDLTEARIRNDQTKTELQKAEAQLKESQAQLTRWNRRVATLEKLIEVAPVLTALGEVKDFEGFKTTAKGLAEQFRDVEVTYVDAGTGKPDTKKLKDEVGELLDDARALMTGDREAGSIVAGLKEMVTPQAPGLVVTVAALAKDMAEAERARTAARLSALERRRAVATRLGEILDLAKKLVSGGRSSTNNFAAGDHIEKTLGDLAKTTRPDKDDPLAKAMNALQVYVTVAGPLTARLREAQREDAYLRHLHSIEQSLIAVNQHQALMARGLEGVAAYHAGGFKPEQVADLVHKAVQLVLLGVIAGGQ